jgi:hexosaminidase
LNRRVDALEGLVRVKRFFTGLAIALLVVVVLFVTLRTQQWVTPASLIDFVGGGQTNPAPAVVPSLREWHSGTGTYALGSGSRITVDSTFSAQLQPTAQVFQADLTAVTQRTLRVVVADAPQSGDFFLSLGSADKGLGGEGYTLTIGAAAIIRANTTTGVFYGTRTALQILLQDAARTHLPRGAARDYPKYKERGFMLDVARKFFSLSALKDYVRMMSWYKLNDFHLHFNDNVVDAGKNADWTHQYATFRLGSDRFPGLAAKDGSYSQQDIRALQDMAEARGVTITPEIDAPAHDLAITQYRPDLAIPGNSNKEFLDLGNPGTYTFMNSIWDEFLPWFDAKQVDIGADEYDTADPDNYRRFINTFDHYLSGKGKTVRMWGGLSQMKSTVAVNTDITLELWDNGAANPVDMDHQGFTIINANDFLLYIVPHSTYFHDYLDLQALYAKWEPYIFDLNNPGGNLPSGDPRVLGGSFADWNDGTGASISDADVYNRVKPAVPVVGDKLWSGATSGASFDQFQRTVKAIGDAPGALPAPH